MHTAVEVVRLATEPAHRRQKLAIAALAAALRWADERGAEYAVAHVPADRLAAMRCLLRVGFEPELTDAGQEAAWERLLGPDSGRHSLL